MIRLQNVTTGGGGALGAGQLGFTGGGGVVYDGCFAQSIYAPAGKVKGECVQFKNWADLRAKTKFKPLTERPGIVYCPNAPIKTKDGRSIPNRPIVPKDDPRSPKISAAIMIFYPKIMFNHTYNAVFQPEGNVLSAARLPVVFAFPLDEKVINDEMIDLAAEEIKKGTFDKAFKQAPNAFVDAVKNMQTGYKYGKYLGPVGGVIGAWIGGVAAWFTGVFGRQDYDTPEELEAYDSKNAAIRNKAGINYHYSNEDYYAHCSVLWFDKSRAQYTLLEGFDRLAAKIAGKPADEAATQAATATAQAAVARSSVSPRARRSCFFIGGGRRFPCTKSGARQAVGAARAAGGSLLFRYGRRQIDMSMCLAQVQAPIAPPPYGYGQPARATRTSHRRRPLRGLGLGGLDTQNISTLTIQVPSLGAARSITPRLTPEDPITLALSLIGALAVGISGYLAVRA